MNKVKRLLSLILVVALLGSMLILPVSAAGEEVKLEFEKTSNTGFNAILNVKVPGNVITFSAILLYDPNVVTPGDPSSPVPKQDMTYDDADVAPYEAVSIVTFDISNKGVDATSGVQLATFPFTLNSGKTFDDVTRSTVVLETGENADRVAAFKAVKADGSVYVGTNADEDYEFFVAAEGKENMSVQFPTPDEDDFPGMASAPVLTSVRLTPSEVTVDGTNEGSHEVQSQALDQRGKALSGATWSISGPTGAEIELKEALDKTVSIERNTGKITVGNNAVGGPYTVTATAGGVSKTATLTVNRANSSAQRLVLSIADSIVTLGHDAALTLRSIDQFEQETRVASAAYTVIPADSGVTVSSAGTISVAANAKLGEYTITATANGLTSNELKITVQDKPKMVITGLDIPDKTYDNTPVEIEGTATATANGSSVDLSGAKETILYKVVNGSDLGAEAPKDAGSYSAEITYETADYIGTQTIKFTIRPVELTVAPGLAAVDRAYDGTKTVTLEPADNITGLVSGDGATAKIVGSMASADAANNKPVTLNVVMTGEAQKNYTLDRASLPELTVNIAKRTLEIADIKVVNKVYDGTDSAVVEEITFTGAVSGETPTYKVTGATFNSANVDEATMVSGTVELTGSFATNYELAEDVIFAEAEITPAKFSVQLPYETLTVKKDTTGIESLIADGVKAIPSVAGEEIESGDVDFRLGSVDTDEVGEFEIDWTCSVLDPNFEGRETGKFTLIVTENDPVNVAIENKPEGAVIYGDDPIDLIATAFRISTDGKREDIDSDDFVWEVDTKGVVEIDETGKLTIIGAGRVTIKVSLKSNSAAYQSFTLDIPKKPVTVEIRDLTVEFGEDIAFDFDIVKGELADGDTKSDLKISYDIDPSTLGVGSHQIKGSSRSDAYDVTVISGVLTIMPGHIDDVTLQDRLTIGATEKTIDLSSILNEIKGNFEGIVDIKQRGDMVSEATFNKTAKELLVKYTPLTTGKAVIDILIDAANYDPFTITVELEAIPKTWVDIVFVDSTVEYDGREHKLAEATVNGSSDGITYNYGDKTGETTLPAYTNVGTYPVTAVYESDTEYGSKIATLRIIDSLAPTAKGTTPNESVRVQDQNAAAFDVYVNPVKAGEYIVNIRGRKSLTTYERDGERGAWVGILLGLAKSGSPLTSFLFGETKADMTSADLISALDFGGNGKETLVWIDTNQCPITRYISSGGDVITVTFTFDEYQAPTTNFGGSGASHTVKVFSNDTSTSGTDKVKPDSRYTTISGSTVVTSIKPNATVSNGIATASVDASTVTSRLKENEAVADYEDRSSTALQVDTSGTAANFSAITLPTDSVSATAKAGTALWLTTGSGEVRFSAKALRELADQADGDTIVFTVGVGENGLVSVTATSGGVQLSDLGGNDADVTVDYENGTYYVYLVGEGALDEQGNVVDPTKLTLVATNARASGGELSFTTRLLGQFLVTQTQYDNAPKAAVNFSDVPASHWAIDAINDLASRGIVAGMGNGNFAPDAQVTREQFVRMLAGVSNEQQPATTASRFTDVSATAWSLAYIEWAADRGITYGKTATTFEPTAPISRQEMASMIYRYIQNSGKELPKTNSALAFNDQSEIGAWAADSVAVMQQAGIINGVAVNGGFEFRPTNAATRAECAAMLSALIKLI